MRGVGVFWLEQFSAFQKSVHISSVLFMLAVHVYVCVWVCLCVGLCVSVCICVDFVLNHCRLILSAHQLYSSLWQLFFVTFPLLCHSICTYCMKYHLLLFENNIIVVTLQIYTDYLISPIAP